MSATPTNPKRVLAIDLGASSGRAILGSFDGKQITLQELHRFTNEPVMVGNTLYWDVLRLLYEIKQGIAKAAQIGFDSLGIDTWGVDFGLIDSDGAMIENPVHYRDSRTSGMLEESFKLISKEELYSITGNQLMEINTAFQLLSLAKNRPHILERADKLLLMPDLFAYMLTNVKASERSIASTSQLVDANKGKWSQRVLSALSIPERLFTPIVNSGTTLGQLTPEVCTELNIKPAKVIAVCAHDTQSAVQAVPAKEKDFIFISCGTWSLFGTELPKPILNEDSARLNVTNEAGYAGTTTFLKNIIGLWLIQESRRQWAREGKEYSYAELERLALATEPFKCFIDPDAPEFVPQGDIPKRVREYCSRTGQYVPETVGEVMRCIYESLALKYRNAFDEIRACTGKEYSTIHVVGGGAKDGLLCRMTANSCNCEVMAGPIEATVLGNISTQLISSGDIKDMEQAREIIASSQPIKCFSAKDTDKWNEAFSKYIKFI